MGIVSQFNPPRDRVAFSTARVARRRKYWLKRLSSASSLGARWLLRLDNRIRADVSSVTFDAVLTDEEIVKELHETFNRFWCVC